MYTINWMLFSIISIITLIIGSIFFINEKNSDRKLIYLFTIITTYIYSGIGMSFFEIGGKYILQYFIFLICILCSIALVFNTSKYRYITINKRKFRIHLFVDSKEELDSKFLQFESLYLFLSILFILTLLVYLFIPTIRIAQLWNPPTATLIGLVTRVQETNSNNVLQIANIFNLLLLPFFLIHLYLLKLKRKNIKLLIWILLWFYLDYLTIGYWGRNEMVRFGLIFFLIFFATKQERIKINKLQILTLVLGFVLAIPFFLNYESYRLGVYIGDLSFDNAIRELFQKETYYPIYYSLIENHNGLVNPINVLLWILFLPIPSIFWGSKPTLAINDTFTTLVTGLSRSDPGFSVALPSILGESFMIWGMHFYWLHAILLGIFIAITANFFKKSNVLSIINLYFIVQILVIGRGGIQSYLSTIINGSISIFIWYLIINQLGKRRQN